jgi:hypothetical protein
MFLPKTARLSKTSGNKMKRLPGKRASSRSGSSLKPMVSVPTRYGVCAAAGAAKPARISAPTISLNQSCFMAASRLEPRY